MEKSEIREYYQLQGESANHQRLMYETGDMCSLYIQNRRKEVMESIIRGHGGHYFLDVGCAEGAYTEFATKYFSVSVGVDISVPKLRRAMLRRTRRAYYIAADAEHLPFSEDSFDMTTCVDMLRYASNPTHVLRELVACSNNLVAIQSGTPLSKIWASKFIHRDYLQIRHELLTNPFAGAIWVISSRSLRRICGKGSRIIGAVPSFILYQLLPLRLRYHAMFLADKIYRSFNEITPLNLLSEFTTVVFRKENFNGATKQ